MLTAAQKTARLLNMKYAIKAATAALKQGDTATATALIRSANIHTVNRSK